MNYSKTWYLNNIKWVTVLVVVLYHVCYIFNGLGILGNIPSSQSIPFFDDLMAIVYPWFMVLLFVVAGADSFYSLEKRSSKEFIESRTIKLLVPSTLGLFVYQWLTGYMGMWAGGALELIPAGIRYFVAVLSGTGPLWFIQVLWVDSLILVLLRKINAFEKLRGRCGKANILVLILLSIIVWLSGLVLNMPVITVYRWGIYLCSFLIGYLFFSHETVQAEIEKFALPLTVGAVILGAVWIFVYHGVNYTEWAVLESPLTVAYLWVAVLAIWGVFKKYFNTQTTFNKFMNSVSYGVYLVHYPILNGLCLLTSVVWHLPALACYVIGFVCVYPASVLVYELLKRIPVIRWLVLGISGKR